jgi:hypothetical protein
MPDIKNPPLNLILSLILVIALISPIAAVVSDVNLLQYDVSKFYDKNGEMKIDKNLFNDRVNARLVSSIENEVKNLFFNKTGINPSKVTVSLDTADPTDLKVQNISIRAGGDKKKYGKALQEIKETFKAGNAELE